MSPKSVKGILGQSRERHLPSHILRLRFFQGSPPPLYQPMSFILYKDLCYNNDITSFSHCLSTEVTVARVEASFTAWEMDVEKNGGRGSFCLGAHRVLVKCAAHQVIV